MKLRLSSRVFATGENCSQLHACYIIIFDISLLLNNYNEYTIRNWPSCEIEQYK